MFARGFFIGENMANRIKRPCRQPGCPELVASGYCDKHKPSKELEKRRGSAAERGYDARWSQESKRYLQQHPLCEPCLKKGNVHAAQVVDHIIPHRGDMKLFWDKSNWQAMSKRCHDKKTASEDGGFGNKR